MLEFLALSLSAGEGVRDALRRVARVGSGALADLIQRVVDESAVGVPLPTALTVLGDELRIAKRLDDPFTPAGAASTLSRELGSILADLREPPATRGALSRLREQFAQDQQGWQG